MSTRPTARPSSPASLPLTRALDDHEGLAGLMQRVRESQARLHAATDALPAGLRGSIRPGPLDEAAWTLLVPSAAAAAKLRQCLPSVTEALRGQGFDERSIRIKVSPAGGAV